MFMLAVVVDLVNMLVVKVQVDLVVEEMELDMMIQEIMELQILEVVVAVDQCLLQVALVDQEL